MLVMQNTDLKTKKSPLAGMLHNMSTLKWVHVTIHNVIILMQQVYLTITIFGSLTITISCLDICTCLF